MQSERTGPCSSGSFQINECLLGCQFADLSTSLRSKTCDERFRIELKSINRYARLSGITQRIRQGPRQEHLSGFG
jgi:hypothetical protein